MRRYILAWLLAASCLLPAVSSAATAYIVNLNSAILLWDAGVGGSTPTEYRVKTGPASGSYTQTTAVAYPTSTLAVSSAVSGVGRWFAVITAWNATDGESGPSNEILFIAQLPEQLGATETVTKQPRKSQVDQPAFGESTGSRKGKKVQERLGIKRKLSP